ncbi:MAG: hypothetical protein M1816_000303 [Peltula sp. TS41687]|nr:MAG: hypothetical protein M1816_000303 [Peltula sp. TS41687]
MATLQTSDSKSKAWHVVAADLCILEPHQKYWYDGLGSVLSILLENAGYGQRAQIDMLHDFAVLVAPSLGRAPVSGLQRWPSFMTDDHTPVEFSWDFHTGNQQPTIRYSFEPILLDVGTLANTNNTGASADFKESLIKRFPRTDTLWFNHFEDYFATTSNDAPTEGHSSTIFWAFDLTEKGASAKAYFFPGAVARATKRTNFETVSAAIASAPGYHAGNFPSFEMYKIFANQPSRHAHELDMLALDLEPSEKSRLKVYFRDRRTSFASVRENMSLGGLLDDVEFEKAMQKLRMLWDVLFGTEGVPEDTALPRNEHRTAGILYNVEFRFQKKAPLAKVYIPVRHYAQSDEQISEALKWYMTEKVGQRRDLPIAAVSAKLYRRCINQAL